MEVACKNKRLFNFVIDVSDNTLIDNYLMQYSGGGRKKIAKL